MSEGVICPPALYVPSLHYTSGLSDSRVSEGMELFLTPRHGCIFHDQRCGFSAHVCRYIGCTQSCACPPASNIIIHVVCCVRCPCVDRSTHGVQSNSAFTVNKSWLCALCCSALLVLTLMAICTALCSLGKTFPVAYTPAER